MMVFLSYARDEDELFVHKLHKDLIARGFKVWWDREAMLSRGQTFLQVIIDAIHNECERLILVVGPRAVASDYVRIEWEHALLACKVVTPILRLGELSLLPAPLANFHCPDFRAERDYAVALAELTRLLRDPILLLGELRFVPSLPAPFLAREHDLDRLREIVLADVNRPVVIPAHQRATALQGMSGVGKSSLAAALAHDCQIRRGFRDGVVWLTLGPQPNLPELLARAGEAFGDAPHEYLNIEGATARLTEVLADKNCLLVLDDVWASQHAQPFITAPGSRCWLLLTTRDGTLVTALGIQEIPLDVLNEGEAVKVLGNWAGKAPETLPSEARAVAALCGRLPLALALCGAMARDGASWADVAAALREADLAALERQFPDYPYPNMLAALKASVEALADDAQERYRELAAFARGEAVPEAAALALWQHTGGLNARGARQLLVTLERKTLLRLEGKEPERRVTLHDLQHDYLCATAGDLTGLHEEVLTAYHARCPGGWPAGPNDGYFFLRLPYHLRHAGRSDELRALLLDFAWLRAKLNATTINALIADFDLLADEGLGLIQHALQLAAPVLARDKTQLATQLAGRLLSLGTPEAQTLLESLRQKQPAPWLRPLSPSLMQVGKSLAFTLTGHSWAVNAVAVTPDGRWVISGGGDKWIKIWDLQQGKELHTLKGHTGPVTSVAVTPDGRRLISASADRTLKVWDLSDFGIMLLRTLSGHTDAVTALAVTPDGRFVISASNDATLKVWEVDTGSELYTLTGHTDSVNAVAVTPDSRRIVSASSDTALKVWSLERRVELYALRGHNYPISTLVLTPDGRYAISGSFTTDRRAMRGEIKVWDISPERPTGTAVSTLHTPAGNIRALAITPDGRYLIAGSSDRTLTAWDISTEFTLSEAEGRNAGLSIPAPVDSARRQTLSGHTDSVNAVAASPDGRLIVSGSEDSTLKVWGISTALNTSISAALNTSISTALNTSISDALNVNPDRPTARGHAKAVEVVAVTPNGRHAISGSRDATIKIWEVENGAETRTLKGHTRPVTSIAVIPDGRRLVSASNGETTLRLWDVASGKEHRLLKGHTGPITVLAVSPDGRHVISGSWDTTLRVWDIASDSVEPRLLKGHAGPITALAVTPDSNRVFSGSADATIKEWELNQGRELLFTPRGHADGIRALLVTPDSRRLISAADDGILKVWNITTPEREPLALRGHIGGIRAIALTPDSRHLISAADSVINVWDISASGRGAEPHYLRGHTGGVRALAVTLDNRYLISVAPGDALKVWELEIGEAIASFTGESDLLACAVAPDGLTLAAGEASGQIHILRLEKGSDG